MTERIDFSCKHGILIRNGDGSLVPMDQPYFSAQSIAPGTWQVLSDGDYSYLVEGEDQAVVIDSGYGCGNIRAYCQSLTDRPLRFILNTHDHFDHTAGNCYFECAYLSEETRKRATLPFPSFAGIHFPRDYPVRIIGEGFVFQLGGRDLEAFSIPDHAPGSLAFLDRKARILFSGDELMAGGKALNGSVETFVGHLEKLMEHRGEFDWLCAGEGILDGDYVDCYLANARYILAGHEGQPAVPGEPPAPSAPGPRGETVYDRLRPRLCDIPHGDGRDQPYRRVMEYAGCRITYEIRKIRA